MIKTRKDLRLYLEEDRRRSDVSAHKVVFYLRLLSGNENAAAYRYLKNLRYLEYRLNNFDGSLYHKILYYYHKFVRSRLGFKYSISIHPNSCGYGVHIIHLSGGGGVRIAASARCGNYCSFNAGVLLGTKDALENCPTIGDHVVFAPHSMAFGKITIGNNVFVAPNAVVTKDVPDNCVVGGIPAKVLKVKTPKA